MNILDQALIPNSATSPPHATILKLDTKVRSCAIPAKLQLKDAAARSQVDDMLLLQHYTSMVGNRKYSRFHLMSSIDVEGICSDVSPPWYVLASSLEICKLIPRQDSLPKR